MERRVMAVGRELHSDDEAALIEDGSAQASLWGINLYPAEQGDAWIEFDSMVNVRPSHWTTLTLAEQLANVGSEVERAITAWEARRTDRFDKALARALELFDLTAEDDRWRGHRRREILRAREEFCRLFFDDEASPEAARTLRDYFLHLTVLARRRSG